MVWTVLSTPVARLPGATEEYDTPLPFPSSFPCQTRRYWPALQVPHVMTLVQHLVVTLKMRCPSKYWEWWKNHLLFKLSQKLFVLASYATVNLCTSKSVSGNKEALAGPETSPLEAVLLAGRFPLHTLLWNYQATHPDLQCYTKWKTYNVWSGTRMYYG